VKITIHPAMNGATMVVDQQEPDIVATSEVYEFCDDNDDASLSGIVRLLHDVAEHLGVVGHKRAKARLSITVEHGYDYECDDKANCAICKENQP